MLAKEEERAAEKELKIVQSAVKKMMRDRGLIIIPNPVLESTSDMSAFALEAKQPLTIPVTLT